MTTSSSSPVEASPLTPDLSLSARDLFKIDTDLQVPAFSAQDEHVPPLDPDYVFDRDTTLALLAGFLHNRRVLVQGRHGTGKSSHIEQVASRLNWPCVRVNLDGHVTRMDLIGKDTIAVRDGRQITEFQPGMLTWALQRPCALVFDEYDAGRADVMFVIQRVLDGSRVGKAAKVKEKTRALSSPRRRPTTGRGGPPGRGSRPIARH